MSVIHSFLLLSPIPLQWIYYSLFPVTCQRKFFFCQFLVIVKKSCLKHFCTGFYVNVGFYFSRYLGVGLLDHLVSLVLLSEKLRNCLLEWLYTILHSHQQHMHSSSTSSPTLDIVSIFYFSHSNRCVVILHLGINLYYSSKLLFSYGYLPSVYPVCWRVCSGLLPIFKIGLFFIIQFWEIFIYFG